MPLISPLRSRIVLASASNTARALKGLFSALGEKLFGVFGDDTIPLNGEFDIVVPAGQTEVTFAVWAQGDIDTDQPIDLTVRLDDLAGGDPVTDTLTLTVDARSEPADPATTNTVTVSNDDPAFDTAANDQVQLADVDADPDNRFNSNYLNFNNDNYLAGQFAGTGGLRNHQWTEKRLGHA